MFDPALYAEQLRPFGRSHSLPAWCYTAPGFHVREVERCFAPAWNFIGHASELDTPGSYLAADLVTGPVVALRGADGVLRAFANVCRHRGARLLAEGAGRLRAIACPYHAWTYDAAGRLIGAPRMKDVAGFDRADWGLVPLRLESWQGLLFVAGDAACPPLADYLGDFTIAMASHDLAAMRVVRRDSHDIACNWKLLAENALEEYHTGVVHRGSLGQQHSEPVETRGAWDAIFIPQATTIAVLPEDRSTLPPIAGLAGRAAHGTYFTIVYPNTQFALTQDCLWWLNFHPLGHDRTRLRLGFCFPAATVARADFAEQSAKYFRRWSAGIAEDNGVGPMQQAGLASAFHRPGPLAPPEFAVHRFQRWLLGRVLDGPNGQGQR
jgi:phenylpropionate dioxygenase-like ring-hydroxylating dioxygenase large terminal subunit